MKVTLEINEEVSGLLWEAYDAYDDSGRLIARLHVHKGYQPTNLELEEQDNE